MTVAIDAQVVKDLRERTGAGMMDCKKALIESAGDVEKAIEILRKKGVMAATKRAGRVASEGLISGYISPDAKMGVLVELNCETDFVAKTDQFTMLLNQYVNEIAQGNYSSVSEISTQAITEAIAATGENIVLTRFSKFQVNTNGMVDSYIHAGAKLGVLVELQTESETGASHPQVRNLAHEIAMQIAAQFPDYVSRNEISKEILDKELEIYREQAKQEGKPEKILDKIAQGKLGKFYTQVCLMEQPYIRDQNISVGKLIEQTGKEIGGTIKIVRFARYKIGEAK